MMLLPGVKDGTRTTTFRSQAKKATNPEISSSYGLILGHPTDLYQNINLPETGI